ncbi:FtsX-like permease family protein [Spirosoma taeanense]|uniref:FtsX-like permease family protein n=1 Tax=Spirosoma taeanense TaxID=2735870 RepID=A0A6M5YBY3_9BACT|nr:ABC transporter permease [Spirosoma taeanense]QJW91479.1 FtsX-like permease family protein [Spirosoma taeanense]
MLKSYFTTALRALKRNGSYTVINLVGLTFGLACCLILFLAIRYELSHDRHHAHADRIYRIITRNRRSEGDGRNSGIPLPALAALRSDFPELKRQLTLVYDARRVVVRVGGPGANKFEEEGGMVAFAEPEYFRLFDYQWKSGNPQTALNNPNTVVLSERMAHKYFGDAEPMGKTIRVDNKMDFVVSGVVQDPPATSSVPFEVLLSFASLKQFGANTDWNDWQSTYSGCQIYLMLPPQMAPEQTERQLVAFANKYLRPEEAKDLKYELQPLTTIHFDSRTGNFAGRTISKEIIWAMGLIGLFILITACVNFINLATAQAIRRAKEVGVRKVLGSTRVQLVRQFLGETGLLTGLSVGLALLVAYLALPYVADLLNIKQASLHLTDPVVISFLVVLAVITTVLAGFYPALVLSGYQPALALKGKVRSSGGGQLTLRRGLIVFQFAISQLLLIGTIVAYSQMKYFRSADLGYNKEAVLTIPIPDHKPGQLETLRARLINQPNVQSLSYGISVPSANGNWWTGFRYENAEKDSDYGVVMRPADTAYVRTYGLKLIAGRMYLPADTMREFVVNESFVKRLGIRDPRQIIGKSMALSGRPSVKKPIVGVVRDFNTFSLHQKTEPCVLTSHRDAYNTLGIKLSTRQGGTEAISQLLGEVEKAWTATFPDFVFRYEFLDQTLADFYQSEERMYSLFRLLAGIAIFIGCLGLYGVVAFMVESRKKEVGIRKALGASTTHIFGIFSADFVKLVLIALVLASPIAWYVMSEWLDDFVYRIDIEWWMFALTGGLAIGIALLTVSFQSIKAALMNPVNSLRTE